MKKIFVNIPAGFRDDSFITPNVKKKLEENFLVKYNETGKPLSGEALAEQLKDCYAVITGWGQPRMYLKDLGDVKVIAHTGGTVGGIVDLEVFDSDITVLSGNNYYAQSVAEGVVAYMLFALRRMGYYGSMMKNGGWTWDAKTEGLLGQTVGIVSLGAISSRLIPMLKPFTDKIKVYSTHEDPEVAKRLGFEYASLDEIFKTCKIVTVHTAKNDETFHMINRHHFDLLQDGALFVNTSRGAVIDEAALCDTLKENRFNALLDVYECEPPKKESPLMELDNVILFPHMAGPTYDRRERITEALIEDVISIQNGGTSNDIVTKEIAEKMTIS